MQKPIYICITSYFPTPESWRCAFIFDQVKAIQRTGMYRVFVVNTDAQCDYNYQGVEVVALHEVRRGLILAPFVFEHINVRRLLKLFVKRGIAVSDIAVVHTHLIPVSYFAAHLKKLNPKIKAMVQFHDADPYGTLVSERCNWFGVKRIAYFRYHRKLAEQMDACVAVSENVKRVAIDCPRQMVFNKYPPVRKSQHDLRYCRTAKLKKIVVLHNGVDSRQFNRFGGSGRKSEVFTIGAIGNFRDLKDYKTLFKALNEIKDRLGKWHIKVIGTGKTRAECERFISEKGLAKYIEFCGEVAHERLPEFYRSIDLFVLPSYFEGFGCVFTESWACGAPFITCEGQGMDDLIYNADRKLWLCKECDPTDLAEKILSFYSKRSSQRLCAEIDIDVLVSKFLDVVADI